MTTVLVRFEAALLDHEWHDEAVLSRTELVEALIGRGLLTVLEEDPAEPATPAAVEAPAAEPAPAEPVAVSWPAAAVTVTTEPPAEG